MIKQIKMTCAKWLVLAIAVCFLSPVHTVSAQDLVPPDTLAGWDVSWDAGFNGAQSTYSNWSKGGVNNLSVIGNSDFNALYRQRSFSYGLRVRTRYGQSRLQDEGVRKIDDRISIRNRFLHDLGDDDVDFSAFLNINFDSQFGRGFDYGAAEDGGDLLISQFMAPAYFTQNAGIAYVPSEYFSAEAGLGLKQTIVLDESLSTRYGLGEGDRLFNEAGFTLGVAYERRLMTNLTYSGYVETFTNMNRAIRRTDVMMGHQLLGRINDYLSMSFQFEMIYDDDFSNEVQLSQVLSAGLSISIL